MKQFYQKIDMRSRTEMINFLRNHFRYNTMNSWNRSSSYANNLKVHNLGLPWEIEQKAFDLLNVDDIYIEINNLINEWNRDHNYQWQAGFNGRSGGYLVIYQGCLEPTKHKSFCTNCGQLNFQTTEKSNQCGVCRQNTRVNLEKPRMMIKTYPGRSIDQDADFEDWSYDELKERVKLVQSFDRLCDDIVAQLIYICENFEVVEQEICVPKTIKVLQEV
ncbi:hypothetical protein ASZ90_019966 [hydrocarbon metagenome]|uniref:Uncharacterized protein n=1 Tax=hydrocarbon metagenome TaxID=938273 RepID=A0A0W8E2H4_9ZZZZ